jgi:hypothetical protein
MNDVVKASTFPAMSQDAVARVAAFEEHMLEQEQVLLETRHCFHAGLYSRSIVLPKGVALTGALIKIDTLVIVSGDVMVYTGENVTRLTGFHVVEASAGRKQAFVALEDTAITMTFASQAKSVDDAEREFTDEFEKLATRRGKP